MEQFDVYFNPNPRTRDAYPYLVDIQSPLLSELATRIVIPLGRSSVFGAEPMTKLTPTIEYAGEELLLLTPQIASLPAKLLHDPIGTIEHLRADIIAALDFAVSGI